MSLPVPLVKNPSLVLRYVNFCYFTNLTLPDCLRRQRTQERPSCRVDQRLESPQNYERLILRCSHRLRKSECMHVALDSDDNDESQDSGRT